MKKITTFVTTEIKTNKIMDNKVYYGEYSLKHWIDLILKGNITLPDYQRHFVWSEKSVKELISAFKEKQFVPPITIGAFKINETNQNFILDGQQRLTSILLAYLGLYPNQKKWEETIDKSANENDDEAAEERSNNALKWTFKELVEIGKNKEDILKNKDQNYYDELKLDIDKTIFEKTLKNTFLGFSYLIPANTSDTKAQQKYYSTVFRNINSKGEKLLLQESRKSLYFLNDNLAEFFAPKFSESFIINNTKLDFVRYLSLLSQYYKDKMTENIAKYYGRKMEEYYEEYIYSTVNNKSEMFGRFSEIFPKENEYKARLGKLEKTITSLGIPKEYDSIIDSDIHLFGLIYEIVFENKEIDDVQKENLKKEIDNEIREIKDEKDNSLHKKTPSALKYLRSRIDDSIKIYGKYVKK